MRCAGATAFDLRFPFLALGDPGRQRRLLVFRQLFDRVLDLCEVHTPMLAPSLALGIGANTAIFSAVDAVLIRPLPYADADRVVLVWEDNTAAGFPRNTPAPGNFTDWKRLQRSFSGMDFAGRLSPAFFGTHTRPPSPRADSDIRRSLSSPGIDVG